MRAEAIDSLKDAIYEIFFSLSAAVHYRYGVLRRAAARGRSMVV
jgi:hypothetical protein